MNLLIHKAIKDINLIFDICPLELVSAIYNFAYFSLKASYFFSYKMQKIIPPYHMCLVLNKNLM